MWLVAGVVALPLNFEFYMSLGVCIFRDVGSISSWGGTTLRGHFSLRKKGHYLKIKRAHLRLLQNLGGHVPPVPPGSYVYVYLALPCRIYTILTGWNTLVFKFGLIQDISWGLKWPNMPLCIPSRVSWDQETYLSSNSHSFCPFKQQDAYLRFFERNHRRQMAQRRAQAPIQPVIGALDEALGISKVMMKTTTLHRYPLHLFRKLT